MRIFSGRLLLPFLATLALAAIVTVDIVRSQDSLDGGPPEVTLPEGETIPRSDEAEAGSDQAKPGKEQKQKRARRNTLWRGKIPDGGAERGRLLDELYRQLAASESEKMSEQLDKVIQRVWISSGSPTVDALVRRALRAQQRKNNELAISLLDRVVDLAPDYAEGFARRAYVLYAEEDVERAIGDLRRAIALDPNHYKALDGLGDIFREIGRNKAALTVYRKLIKVHPHSAGVKTAIQKLELELEGQGI